MMAIARTAAVAGTSRRRPPARQRPSASRTSSTGSASDVNQRWSSSRLCGSTYPSSFSRSITWRYASRRVVMVPSARPTAMVESLALDELVERNA